MSFKHPNNNYNNWRPLLKVIITICSHNTNHTGGPERGTFFTLQVYDGVGKYMKGWGNLSFK